MSPTTLISLDELNALRDAWESRGFRVAFVPTMGALHEGHLSLARQARKCADKVIVSIFVNPTQFGPNEDFERYPRTLKSDLELLATVPVEAVFLPNAGTMYPEGFQTYVHNKKMADGLCGASRPGHFEGVLTVVLKLFNQVRPHVALFGKKDYQQFRLIERMAKDLNLRVQVMGCETLRDPDGLAMSSRNRYLSDEDRKLGLRLYKGLAAAKKLAASEKSPAKVLAAFHQEVSAPGLTLEYAELRRQSDLGSYAGTIDAPAVLLAAARVGTTRLIDNLEMP